MTIYLDVVMIENLIMNSIIIYSTAIIIKEKIKHIRIILSSFIGATYSILSYISTLEIYSSIWLKFTLSVIMVYIAFGAKDIKKLGKQLVIFYLTSFVFGGVAFSLIYIVKPQDILMKDGLFLGTYPLKTVFFSAILASILIIVAFKIVKSKMTKKDIICDVIVKYNQKEIKIKTMLDTGNMLKEPISGMPVIVIEKSALYELLPKEILDHLESILGGDFENITQKIKKEYMSQLKLIPYSSLGKQNGMLLGIKADEIQIIKEEKTVHKNVVIGIYEKSLTKRGEYRGLIGMELI